MICKSCLMPDTRPDTEFVDGECSACISYRNRPQVDWHQRHQELMQLLDRFNGECIVPSSGGKDSTAQVIKLKRLGADVTIVTARTCMLTDIGRKNIDNLSRYARTIEVVPNMAERADLNRIGLETVGDISLPEHWAIFATPFRMAVDLGIPLIMYGECPQNQYGGPIGSEKARQLTRRWVHEFGGFNGLRPSDIEGYDMTFYTLPDNLDGIEAHFLGAYMPWDSHENAELAMEHGMQTFGEPPGPANWWKWENLDNAQTGIHDRFMWLKYGYSRCTAQLSVDIRSGRLKRKWAVTSDKLRIGRFPNEYAGVPFEAVLEHIGMNRERYNQLERQFYARHESDTAASM